MGLLLVVVGFTPPRLEGVYSEGTLLLLLLLLLAVEDEEEGLLMRAKVFTVPVCPSNTKGESGSPVYDEEVK